MRLRLLVITALVASAAIAAALFVQSLSSIGAQAQTRPRYLPENTASGDSFQKISTSGCSKDLEALGRFPFRSSRRPLCEEQPNERIQDHGSQI
jgi:hypothetical protein